LLDVLVFFGLAFTHQIGADRDLSGFERGFRMFEECFSDSVRWWVTQVLTMVSKSAVVPLKYPAKSVSTKVTLLG